MINYYEVLGVDPGASADVIKHVYRQLAKAYHPDANPGNQAGIERFKLINTACETLMDPVRRREHDRELGLHTSASPGQGASSGHAESAQRARPRPDNGRQDGPRQQADDRARGETAEQRQAREARQESEARERRARQRREQAERERIERQRRERAEWERLAGEKAAKEKKRRFAEIREGVFWREFVAWREAAKGGGRVEREALDKVRVALYHLSPARQSRVAQEADRRIAQKSGSANKPTKGFQESREMERAKEAKGLRRRLNRKGRKDWDLAEKARKQMRDAEKKGGASAK